MPNRTKNCFDSSFVIVNGVCCHGQKKNSIGFVPFGTCGLTPRGKGIPYKASRGGETGLGNETRLTTLYNDCLIYFDFQEGSGATLTNRGSLGSIANATLSTYGGAASFEPKEAFRYTSTPSLVLSGSYSTQFNFRVLNENKAYAYVSPGFEGGYSPELGGFQKYQTAPMTGKLPDGSTATFPPQFYLNSGSFTVAMWFKCTGSYIQNLFSIMLPGTTENTSCGLYLLPAADNKIVFDGNGFSQGHQLLSTVELSTLGINPRDGNWHHVALVCDGERHTFSTEKGLGPFEDSRGTAIGIPPVWRLFVDGANATANFNGALIDASGSGLAYNVYNAGTDTYNEPAHATSRGPLNLREFGTNNDSFLIGRGLHRSAKHLSGTIGEFAFWSGQGTTQAGAGSSTGALSAKVIKQLYAGGDPSSRSNLVDKINNPSSEKVID